MRGDGGVAGQGRVVGVPKFHSWGKCTMPLTNINSMDMMKQLEENGFGVIMDGTWCGGLMYADDIVLLAETGTEL